MWPSSPAGTSFTECLKAYQPALLALRAYTPQAHPRLMTCHAAADEDPGYSPFRGLRGHNHLRAHAVRRL